MTAVQDANPEKRQRVLFVDEDELILSGLARALHPWRREWEMDFITGLEEATARLDRESFDVVVADVRMPPIDGMTVLAHARQRCPGAVRIALSDRGDRNVAPCAAGVAHQYLPRPCAAKELHYAMRRGVRLRGILQTERLAAVVHGIERLPSAPAVYQEVASELRAAHPSLRKIARRLARDPALSAKLLQLVNSPFFPGAQHHEPRAGGGPARNPAAADPRPWVRGLWVRDPRDSDGDGDRRQCRRPPKPRDGPHRGGDRTGRRARCAGRGTSHGGSRFARGWSPGAGGGLPE